MNPKKINFKELQVLISIVEEKEGATIEDLKSSTSTAALYYKVLYHVTTTNSVVSLMLNIPIQKGSFYKNLWEKRGALVKSKGKLICKVTGRFNSFLTTNPNEYERVMNMNISNA